MRKIFCLLLSCAFIQILSAQDTAKSGNKNEKEIYVISALTKYAENEKYGLTPEFPVKVGNGVKGGPANQKAFLDLLRDVQGNPVNYERKGSCCAYASPNGFMGYAMVDKYEVSYKDADGKKQKTFIYISFYDYEEPMIPAGFKTINN